jgi:hypothetical protein
MARTLRVLVAALFVLGLASGGLAQDRIYVSTFESFPDGTIYEIDFGTSSATALIDGFHLAEDIACKEETEELFICESLSSVVSSYDLVGGGLTNIIPSAGRVEGPEGPSISPAGDLYMNTRGQPIVASGVWMVPDGDPTNAAVNTVPRFSAFGEGSAFGKAGVSDGGLLAVDRDRGRVYLSNPPGDPATVLITGLNRPFGVAVNSLGQIFVAEKPTGGGGFISYYEPDGTDLGNFITGLNGPTFLEVDSADNLVVADTDRVLLIDPTGAIIGNVRLFAVQGVAICLEPAQQFPCPHSQGFWKTHPAAWPVDELVLGTETYTKAEARALLKTPIRGDASLILAKQLIAAKLNIEDGADPAPVDTEITDADDLLATYPARLPLDVHPSTPEGKDMTDIAAVLDDYNNRVFTPDCDDTRPVAPASGKPGFGCGGVVGARGPQDILGSLLPLMALAIALCVLSVRRRLEAKGHVRG